MNNLERILKKASAGIIVLMALLICVAGSVRAAEPKDRISANSLSGNNVGGKDTKVSFANDLAEEKDTTAYTHKDDEIELTVEANGFSPRIKIGEYDNKVYNLGKLPADLSPEVSSIEIFGKDSAAKFGDIVILTEPQADLAAGSIVFVPVNSDELDDALDAYKNGDPYTPVRAASSDFADFSFSPSIIDDPLFTFAGDASALFEDNLPEIPRCFMGEDEYPVEEQDYISPDRVDSENYAVIDTESGEITKIVFNLKTKINASVAENTLKELDFTELGGSKIDAVFVPPADTVDYVDILVGKYTGYTIVPLEGAELKIQGFDGVAAGTDETWFSERDLKSLHLPYLVSSTPGFTKYSITEIATHNPNYELAPKVFIAIDNTGVIKYAYDNGGSDDDLEWSTYDEEISIFDPISEGSSISSNTVTIKKVDSRNGAVIGGAKFKISGNNIPASGYTLDVVDGTYDIDLQYDKTSTTEYYLTETSSPVGYTFDASKVYKIKIDEAGYVYLNDATRPLPSNTVTIENTPVTARSLKVTKWGGSTGNYTPLTGAELEIIIKKNGVETSRVSADKTKSTNSYTINYDPTKTTTYTIHEKTAPEGYKVAEDIVFTIDTMGNFSSSSPRGNCSYTPGTRTTQGVITVNMYDDKEGSDNNIPVDVAKTITVKKVGADDPAKGLEGAEFKLTVADGNVTIPETLFTTVNTETETGISSNSIAYRTTEDATFKLEETKAPEGYSIADPISFKIDKTGAVVKIAETDPVAVSEDGNTVTITVTDTPEARSAKVKILKQSAGISTGEGIPGAVLKITNAALKVDKDITTVKTATEIELPYSGTEATEYTVTETTPPIGYDIAAPIKFRITAAGVVEVPNGTDWVAAANGTVVMYDNPLPSIVIDVILRAGSKTGSPLKGANLSIKDSYNRTDPGWTWDTTSKSFPVEIYFSTAKDTTYRLVENYAPDKYDSSGDISIRVDTAGNVYAYGGAYAEKKNGDLIYAYETETLIKPKKDVRTIVMVNKRESSSSGGGSSSGGSSSSGTSNSSSGSSSSGSSGSGSGSLSVASGGAKSANAAGGYYTLPSYPGLPAGYVLPRNLTVADVLPLVPYFEALMASDPGFYAKLPAEWQAVYNYMVAAGVLGAKKSPKTGEMPFTETAAILSILALLAYYVADRKQKKLNI